MLQIKETIKTGMQHTVMTKKGVSDGGTNTHTHRGVDVEEWPAA